MGNNGKMVAGVSASLEFTVRVSEIFIGSSFGLLHEQEVWLLWGTVGCLTC